MQVYSAARHHRAAFTRPPITEKRGLCYVLKAVPTPGPAAGLGSRRLTLRRRVLRLRFFRECLHSSNLADARRRSTSRPTRTSTRCSLPSGSMEKTSRVPSYRNVANCFSTAHGECHLRKSPGRVSTAGLERDRWSLAQAWCDFLSCLWGIR